MKAIQKSLRIPEDTVAEIEKIAEEAGKDFSTITKDLLSEAIRIRRCPGITFADGVSGRRARLAGTGIEVWEVIAAFLSVKRDYKRLKKSYHWLTDQQLRSALAYYSLFKGEIDEQIRRNETWTKEKVVEKYPFLSPEAK